MENMIDYIYDMIFKISIKINIVNNGEIITKSLSVFA